MIIILLLAAGIFSIYQCRQQISTAFISILAQRLDKEREIAVGEYNVLSWNDGIFQINHDSTGYKLELVYDDYTVVLLSNINDYKKRKSKLYIVSDDGAAVISNDNIANIFISNNDSEDYTVYKNDKQIIYSQNYNDEHIKYVYDIDEFSLSDKKQLIKMIN